MADYISSKPNYTLPDPNLEFTRGSKDNYETGYQQRGDYNKFGRKYSICRIYNTDYGNKISERLNGENKYGENIEKFWTQNGDTIKINKTKFITFIEDTKTGFLRPLTNEDKEKLLKEGIKLNTDNYDPIKANELLCSSNERLVHKKEIISMTKKLGQKWKVDSYELGDLSFVKGYLLKDLPEQTEIIDKRAYRAIVDFVEKLARKLRIS